jgi:hypothetical protein
LEPVSQGGIAIKAITKIAAFICFFVALCWLFFIGVQYWLLLSRGHQSIVEVTAFFFLDEAAQPFMLYFVANAVIAGGGGILLLGSKVSRLGSQMWCLLLVSIVGIELLWVTENTLTWFMLPFHLYLLYTLIPHTGIIYSKALS